MAGLLPCGLLTTSPSFCLFLAQIPKVFSKMTSYPHRLLGDDDESGLFNATYLGPSEEPYMDAAYLEPNSLVNPNQNTPYHDGTE